LKLSPEVLNWVWLLAKVLIVLVVVMVGFVMNMVWAERKVSAFIQQRRGPNRVGPMGLIQVVADILKMAFKEEVIPREADRLVHFLAPCIIFTMAITALAVIPYDPWFYITDVDFGILFVVAAAGMGSYAVMLAGWGTGSKYPLLGGTRSAAQIISYEIPMLLSMMSVAVMAGSLSLQDIVRAQSNLWFCLSQFPAFLVYTIAMFAETNRLPFDMPEAEAEIATGYMAEFSSLRWGWFYAGEYANMVVASFVMTSLFLGGWQGPFAPGWWWFLLKSAAVLFLMLWVRWTFPRVRYDQLMALGWKILIPVAIVNLVATATLKVLL